MSIAAPALPLYARSFNVDFGTASAVLVVNQLGGAVATLPTGYLIDRFGGRKMVLLGPILAGVASLLMAFAHSFPELLAYRFIEGWGMQMWTIGRLEIITATAGSRRGTQITGMFGMDTAGRLTGPAVGGLVAATFGLRAPFLLYAVVAFSTIVPTFLLVPEIVGGRSRAAKAAAGDLTAPAQGSRFKQAWAEYGPLLTVPMLLLFACQFMASMTRGSLIGGTLDLYAAYAYGVGPKAIGLLAAAGSAMSLPLTFTSGRLMDRFGRRAIVPPGFCFLALGLTIMATSAFARWPFSGYIAVFIFARFALSSVSGTMQVIGSDFAPPNARGAFFGLWALIRNIGNFLSPAIFAATAQTLGFGWSFTLMGIMSLGTAAILSSQLKVGKQRRAAIAVA